MSRQVRRGPGPSSTLITPDRAGNVVGVDPHKRTLTATIVDPRGGMVATEHFRVSGDGHRALEAWAKQFGPIVRFGVEGASAWGRHTAIFLIGRGYDVRDVCPNRTAQHDRARQRGKSDTLDSERIARETLAHPLLPKAFKRAGQDAGPDQQTELLAVWWTARCSLVKRRQHLLTESEALLRELPLELVERLPSTPRVRPRLAALPHLTARRRLAPPTAVRVRILAGYRAQIAELDAQERQITRQLAELVSRAAPRSASCAACRPCRSPSCWSRSAIPAGSPKAALGASTAPRHWPPRPPKAPASPSATATTPAATAVSTRSFTGWPSRSCAASHAPRRSTPTRAPTDNTPKRKLAGSSNDTCRMSFTGA